MGMKSPAERLLAQCPWKEFKAENGKVYFHNNDTKESVWLIPRELQEIKDKIASEQKKSSSPAAAATAVNQSALDAAMAATLAAF